jgi:hypothetical protein
MAGGDFPACGVGRSLASAFLLVAMSPHRRETEVTRTKITLVGVGLALVVGVAAWSVARMSQLEPNSFKRPLHIAGANAMADGGTLQVQLVDSAGRVLLVRRVGSMHTAQSEQELRAVTFWWFMPIEREIPKGSPMEALVKEALKSWLRDQLTQEQKAKLQSNDDDVLRSLPYEVVASYDLASWLDRRK